MKEDCCTSERKHIRVPRSWRSVAPRIITGFAVGILVLVLEANYSVGVGPSLSFHLDGERFSLTFPLFLLIAAFFFARPIFLMKDCVHYIRCHHLRSVSGLMSLRKTTVEIPFEDILGVRVIQSLVERILGVGTIVVWTASAIRPDIEMRGIGCPEKYAAEIMRKVDEKRLEHRDPRAIRLSA